MFAIHRAAATLLVAFGFTDATPNTATLSEAILGDHSSYFERQSGASGVDRLLMWLAVGHGVGSCVGSAVGHCVGTAVGI